MAKIGLALSGGGHRASVFAIGVLMYLKDAGKNKEVNAIASVSGGSLTNGYLAKWGGYSSCDSDSFDKEMSILFDRLARSGTLWGWRPMWAYLGVTLACLFGSIGMLFLWMPGWLRGLACLAGLVVTGKLFERRGNFCGRAYAATLYSQDGKPLRLEATSGGTIDHVYCATDLHAGEHVYFSGDFVASYRFGWGKPADLPLHVAVQASAAFPGGFPAGWLRTKPFEFQDGKEKNAPWMALIDGGVYDNMGEQWFIGLEQRKENPNPLAAKPRESDELIIVNSSANIPWSSQQNLRVPLLGELLTLLRVMLVIHDNTTAPRRRWLVDIFEKADKEKSGQRGALIHIEQTPRRVANRILDERLDQCRDDADRARLAARQDRARAVTDHPMLETEKTWEDIANKNSQVSTTLRALSVETSIQLVRHAYILAMCNLHVLLGYPLQPIPTKEQIRTRLTSSLGKA